MFSRSLEPTAALLSGDNMGCSSVSFKSVMPPPSLPPPATLGARSSSDFHLPPPLLIVRAHGLVQGRARTVTPEKCLKYGYPSFRDKKRGLLQSPKKQHCYYSVAVQIRRVNITHPVRFHAAAVLAGCDQCVASPAVNVFIYSRIISVLVLIFLLRLFISDFKKAVWVVASLGFSVATDL